MAQAAIEQIWDYVNEVLDLHPGKFAIRQLCSRRWYLQALEILFPFLEEEWGKIGTQVQSEQAAIDRILLVLTQEGVIPEEYLSEVKGRNVVIADQESIITLIQILRELVEQALEEAEEGGEEEGKGEEGEEKNQGKHSNGQQQGYNNEYSHKKSEEGEQEQNYEQDDNQEDLPYNYKQSSQVKEQQQPLIKNKMFVTNPRADSEPDRDRDTHSLQGIGNQFDPDQQQQQDSDRKPNTHHHQQPNQAYNIFPQSASSNKPLKATNYRNEEEDEQDNYLDQKLLKCKSEEQLKNLPVAKPKQKRGKKVRTLVSHPVIQKQYCKATTPAQKKLSRTVKTAIADSRKAFDKENLGVQSPSAKDQLQRKKREMNYAAATVGRGPAGRKVGGEKSMGKLKKLLKWKEANLKRQQRELQQQIEMKVQLKKQAYVKKINRLILNLEKEKMLERKREERERRRREREVAERRLQAIEQQYRDQMAMLQGRGSEVRKGVAHLDHKGIIEGLEKELKRESEKQMNGLKTRLRREEAQLDDDLEMLQREIVRAYKKS